MRLFNLGYSDQSRYLSGKYLFLNRNIFFLFSWAGIRKSLFSVCFSEWIRPCLNKDNLCNHLSINFIFLRGKSHGI